VLARVCERDLRAETVTHKHKSVELQFIYDGGQVSDQRLHRIIIARWRARLSMTAQIKRYGPPRLAQMFELRRPVRRVARERVRKNYRQAARAAVIHVQSAC
jgi:hypothetical protein